MSILGIDVSTSDGNIDWQQVVGDNIAFTFIKATEGLQTDSGHEARTAYFRANWARAGQVGLPRGAYHFFRPNEDGQQQADIFLQQLETVAGGELPPMVDVESENGIPPVDRVTFIARLSDFVTTVQEKLGVRPFVYTNTSYWNAHLDNSFGDYPLWIANYGLDQPSDPVAPTPRDLTLPAGFDDFVLWQFTEHGRVAGITGSGVDLNVFRGTLDELLGLGAVDTPITVTVNGNPIPDAQGFLTPDDLSFGWIRPIATNIGATILDFTASSVTLQRGTQTATLAARITDGKAFVHLADLDTFEGMNVAFNEDTNTVAITTA